MTAGFHRVFAILATAGVLGVVVWGFRIVGSPEARRVERLDERRLDDLQDIVYEIQRQVAGTYRSAKLERALPASLEAAAANARYRTVLLVDPETGEPYTYEVLDATTYRLCATFARSRERSRDVFWNHPAGRHCFTINALDPP